MTKEERIDFQYYSAAAMLTVGVLFCAASFIAPPFGEISNSVLWVFGQTLLYAGSIFGLGLYVNHRIGGIETHFNNKLSEITNNNK